MLYIQDELQSLVASSAGALVDFVSQRAVAQLPSTDASGWVHGLPPVTPALLMVEAVLTEKGGVGFSPSLDEVEVIRISINLSVSLSLSHTIYVYTHKTYIGLTPIYTIRVNPDTSIYVCMHDTYIYI